MSNGRLEYTRKPGEKFLHVLKTEGPQTVAELGCAAGVCGEAARQQIQRLAAEGLVEPINSSCAQRHQVGRPPQRWSLTAAGNSCFPDRHAELAVDLIRSIRSQLGEAVLEQVVSARAKESRDRYLKAVDAAETLEGRVAFLADLRDREGYMASYRPDGDGYLLIENHCPICTAAQACQGFCSAELETFQQVIGDGARVERTDHLMSGDRRCAYRITPVPAVEEKKDPAQSK